MSSSHTHNHWLSLVDQQPTDFNMHTLSKYRSKLAAMPRQTAFQLTSHVLSVAAVEPQNKLLSMVAKGL